MRTCNVMGYSRVGSKVVPIPVSVRVFQEFVWNGIKFAVHRVLTTGEDGAPKAGRRGWAVTEVESGMSVYQDWVGLGGTKAMAVNDALLKLEEVGLEGTRDAINRVIKIYGRANDPEKGEKDNG